MFNFQVVHCFLAAFVVRQATKAWGLGDGSPLQGQPGLAIYSREGVKGAIQAPFVNFASLWGRGVFGDPTPGGMRSLEKGRDGKWFLAR